MVPGTHCCSSMKWVDADGAVDAFVGASLAPLASFPSSSFPFFFGAMSRRWWRAPTMTQRNDALDSRFGRTSSETDLDGHLFGFQSLRMTAAHSKICLVYGIFCTCKKTYARLVYTTTATFQKCRESKCREFRTNFFKCQLERRRWALTPRRVAVPAHPSRHPTHVFVQEAGPPVRFTSPAPILPLASG